MRAALDDLSALHHHEPVHARNGGKPMRNGDYRLSFHEVEQLLLDGELDFAVERGRGLVEDEDRRVLEDHSCERDALPLPTRQLHAALADVRRVAGVAAPVA